MKTLSDKLLETVEAAEPALQAIRDADAGRPALGGGWSRKQLLGHLIDSASNNHQRFVRAALVGDLSFPNYDTDGWAEFEDVREAPWGTLVVLWASYNRFLAHLIARLPADRLDAVLRIGTNEPLTLRAVAEGYVDHLRHHLRQIGFTLAAEPR